MTTTTDQLAASSAQEPDNEDWLRDMAAGAYQEALSFGVNENAFMKLARSVAKRAVTAPARLAGATQGDSLTRGKPCEVMDGDPDSPTHRQWFPARFVALDLIGGEPIVQRDKCMPSFATWGSVRGIQKPGANPQAPVATQGEGKPAFWGFMHEAECRVELCFSPSTPRRDGVYATPYYTRPQAPAATQSNVSKILEVSALDPYDDGSPEFAQAVADFAKRLLAAPAKPLTRQAINELSRDAQIDFCLDKQPTYEVALVRAVERALGIN